MGYVQSSGRIRESETLLQRIKLGPYVNLPLSSQTGVSVPGLILIGFSGGILTGLMGVSGGVLFMPILVLGVGLLPHLAVGTSLTVVFIASVTAVIKRTFRFRKSQSAHSCFTSYCRYSRSKTGNVYCITNHRA